MRYGEHHVSILAEETVAQRGRRVTIAITLPHLSARSSLHHPAFRNGQSTIHHRHIDVLAFTSSQPSHESGERRLSRFHTREIVNTGMSRFRWRPIRLSSDGHNPTHGLRVGIVTNLVGQRSPLA